VTYVREEDLEYDVEYENGTVYTIRAKDVYRQTSAVLKRAERGRSKSRGRSPGRPKAATVKRAAAESPAAEVPVPYMIVTGTGIVVYPVPVFCLVVNVVYRITWPELYFLLS
jgi:hypothetical protein